MVIKSCVSNLDPYLKALSEQSQTYEQNGESLDLLHGVELAGRVLQVTRELKSVRETAFSASGNAARCALSYTFHQTSSMLSPICINFKRVAYTES